MEGTPAEIFAQADRLRALGLDVPAVTAVVNRLVDGGGLAVRLIYHRSTR